MSLLPLLTSLARELDEQQEAVSNWDDFGFGIYPCDIYRPRVASIQVNPRRRFSPYQRSYQLMQGKHDAREIPSVGKDGFQVCMDVSHFKPNELTVKTVGNHVVVEGKHEDREDDHGSISRQFVRKYHLPKAYDAKDVVSTISTDGILTVKAPPPAKALKGNERIVQIQQTGPAHLSVRHNREEESNDVEINKTPSKKTDGKQQS